MPGETRPRDLEGRGQSADTLRPTLPLARGTSSSPVMAKPSRLPRLAAAPPGRWRVLIPAGVLERVPRAFLIGAGS